MKQALKKRKLLYACLAMFSIIAIHQSCSKVDVSTYKVNNINSNPTERFFKLPANASTAVRRVAAEMQKRNDKQEFVKSL